MQKDFDYYTLQLMQQGEVRLRVAGRKEIRLEGCCAWFTYPGPYFTYSPCGPSVWNHRYIAFAGEQAKEWQEAGLISSEVLKCPAYEITRCTDAFDAVLHWFNAPGPLAHRRAINLLENLLIDLHYLRTGFGAERRTMPDILAAELERRNYAVLPGKRLAALFGMAESTFRRKFQQQAGMSVNRYLIEQRLLKARRLLQESQLSIQEVSDRTGFSDVYYFHRMFSRMFKITPGRFRKDAF